MTDFTKYFRLPFSLSGNSAKKSEKQLRQEHVLALIPDIIMQCDLERTYIWANQAGFEFFGPDMLGKKADYYFVDKQSTVSNLDPLFSGEQSAVYLESLQRRSDGAKRLLAWWCNPIKDTDGKVIGTISTARDITGQKNDEFNLLEKTIEIESYFNYCLELLCVADTDGYFHRLSKYWEEVLGYPLSEMIGHPYLEFVHPDDIEATVNINADAINQKNIRHFVNRYRHKDGSYRWLEWSSIIMGKIMYASARDITDQRRTEETLSQSEARYRTLVQNSPIVNYQVDPDGVFMLSEGKGLAGLGLQPGQVVGQSIYEIYKDFPIILSSFEKALTGENVNFKGVFNDRAFDSFMEPMVDANGQVSSVIGVSIDLTERYLAEEETKKLNAGLEERVHARTTQLALMNAELESLANSISHDLSAPLRAIDGFSNILSEQYGEQFNEEGRQLFSVIRENVSLMEQMIGDLSTLTRISRNELHLNTIDMNQLVNKIIRQMKTSGQDEGFSIEVQDLPRAFGDPGQITQVWNNLIGNAIKFSAGSEVRRIEINGRLDGNQSTYTIRDFGVGFNPDYSRKLFGVFQRLHNNSQFEGTGIGLAIVKRIIERHGGAVGAEGLTGKGAEFWFSLPNQFISPDK